MELDTRDCRRFIMVVEYLERIRTRLLEEQINFNTELNIANMKFRENVEIIKFLESSIDRNFEAFTPRHIDGFNLRKIDELKIEQTDIQENIDMIQTKLDMVNTELEKVSEVIKVAKENDMKLKSLE